MQMEENYVDNTVWELLFDVHAGKDSKTPFEKHSKT